MKICKIVDEYRSDLIIGYLFYYEKEDVFSIEIDDTLEDKDAPIFFCPFIWKKQFTVSPEWSRRWAEERVVPPDRQNLRSILRDNGLKSYDVFRLLMIAEGRCAQDDCAVKPVRYEELPGWALDRKKKKLEFAVMLNNTELLQIYRDGKVFRTDLNELAKNNRRLSIALGNNSFMKEYRVLAGGLGIEFGGNLLITSEELYGQGVLLPLDSEELRVLAKSYVMDTRDVCDEMNCSRQYVDALTKKNGVSALKDGGVRIYARGDIRKMTE